ALPLLRRGGRNQIHHQILRRFLQHARGAALRVAVDGARGRVRRRGCYLSELERRTVRNAVVDRPRSKPCGFRSSSCKSTTTRLCRNGGWKWSGLAMKRCGLSATIERWNRKIGWWPADWKASGRIGSGISPLRKSELRRREQPRPHAITSEQLKAIQRLG